MLRIKNNKLELTNEIINSADYILNLYVEHDDINYFGILIFNDGEQKVLQFIKTQQPLKYTTRLIITEEEFKKIAKVELKINLVSNSLSKTTNKIILPIDVNGIRQTIKVSNSNEIAKLKLDFAELKTRINNMLEGKVLQSMNIINKDYIKKGMIPVADGVGNWVATYPFLNMVTSVNGQIAVNGDVLLDSSAILFTQDRTIFKTLNDITSAISQMNNSILTLTEQLKAINNRLNQVEIELETNRNSGII